MENEIEGTRWVIPRPSLASNSANSESNNKVSRGTTSKKSRGSASSQGSNSNHSTHSASSGSLLLSAANLSKINELQSSSRLSHDDKVNNYQNNLTVYVHSTGNLLANNEKYPIEEPTDMESSHADPFWNNVKLASAKNQRTRDTESVASSTHFTVVNGFTRHGKNLKGDNQMWCCKSSHQITVLIITMTILFTAGLLAAICYVEMRQRRDVGSRFS
ncbi:uncharacterized protein LOC143909886 isoform X2 [Arctopsyche grandis]